MGSGQRARHGATGCEVTDAVGGWRGSLDGLDQGVRRETGRSSSNMTRISRRPGFAKHSGSLAEARSVGAAPGTKRRGRLRPASPGWPSPQNRNLPPADRWPRQLGWSRRGTPLGRCGVVRALSPRCHGQQAGRPGVGTGRVFVRAERPRRWLPGVCRRPRPQPKNDHSSMSLSWCGSSSAIVAWMTSRAVSGRLGPACRIICTAYRR